MGGTLIEALQRVLRHPIDLTCAGRTDKGVHAHGQVVDFATSEGVDLDGLVRALNGCAARAVAVREPGVVPSVLVAVRRGEPSVPLHDPQRPVPDPFSVHNAWHVRQLDLDRLRSACDPFIGTDDFTSFCRRATRAERRGDSAAVRDVHDGRWVDDDVHTLRFWIEASSFCHQMVRSIVGTHGRCRPRRKPHRRRHRGIPRSTPAAGPVAPPHGLSLWQVRYPDPILAPAAARGCQVQRIAVEASTRPTTAVVCRMR